MTVQWFGVTKNLFFYECHWLHIVTQQISNQILYYIRIEIETYLRIHTHTHTHTLCLRVFVCAVKADSIYIRNHITELESKSHHCDALSSKEYSRSFFKQAKRDLPNFFFLKKKGTKHPKSYNVYKIIKYNVKHQTSHLHLIGKNNTY